MLKPLGLYGHIQRNFLKSALLLASFMILIAITWFAWCIIYTAIVDVWFPHRIHMRHVHELTVPEVIEHAWSIAIVRWWVPVLISSGWFIVAFMTYGDLIRLATGARPLTRQEAPKLYNLVENLAISAGLPMPSIEVIPSDARNAFASGLSPESARITVTFGLLRALTAEELEAVLAHEMTHIRNNDVRLMVIATVFAGGISLLGQGVARLLFPRQIDPNQYHYGYADIIEEENVHRSDRSFAAGVTLAREAEDAPAAALISILVSIVMLALTHVMTLMTKFAISRAREFLADAGAVELTKNPDALISALRKISGFDTVDGVNSNLQAMMISSPSDTLFSTHPPIETRIMALQQYAGGRILEPRRTTRTGEVAANMRGPLAAPQSRPAVAGARASFGQRGIVRA